MWRGVWVSFCKIAIVSFLSVRCRSEGLYCRRAGTRASPPVIFITGRVKTKLVLLVWVPSCNIGHLIYI